MSLSNDSTKCVEVKSLDIPNHFAVVIDNLIDDESCEGFTTITKGQLLDMFVVEQDLRWLLEDADLGAHFFKLLKPYLPASMKQNDIIGIDSRIRLKRVPVGSVSVPHFDHMFLGANGSSYLSVLICLDDYKAGDGGELKFIKYGDVSSDIVIVPKKGRVVVFEHTLLHTRLPVLVGARSVLRTDVMYGSDLTESSTRNAIRVTKIHQVTMKLSLTQVVVLLTSSAYAQTGYFDTFNTAIQDLQSNYQQVVTQATNLLNSNPQLWTGTQGTAYATQLATLQTSYATTIQNLQQQIQALNAAGVL